MYRIAESIGDTLPVPHLIFAKLTAPGADDVRFRVALYALTQSEIDAAQVAGALRVKTRDVERALEFWAGAGLLEQQEPPLTEVAIEPRRRLTTPETTNAAGKSNTLAGLLGELQHIFGGVVSQADYNVFSTLYVQDRIPADLILLASSYCAAQGKANARYIEKLLLGWRREGIANATQADAYLHTLAKREQQEKDVACLLEMDAETFTLAERRKIAAWYEDFGYGRSMIEAACLTAGDKADNIGYLHGILRKWHGKGYATARDVQQSTDNRNLRVHSSAPTIAPEDDVLLNSQMYIPLHRQEGNI